VGLKKLSFFELFEDILPLNIKSLSKTNFMRYAITGAAGNISKVLVQKLLDYGHDVTVIGRSREHLEELVKCGAHSAIGSVEDVEFVKKAFEGADAVFTMCPPNISTTDMAGYSESIGKNYKESIELNRIPHVVNLSSVGAHLERGAGHITGMNRIEQVLNGLTVVNIKHLRPAFFYTNLFAQFGLIRNIGMMGANFSLKRFAIVDPSDVASVAAQHLHQLDFSGHSIRYIASDEASTDEIAAVIGDAIGKPGLRWAKFTDDQALEGFIRGGFPKETANEFVKGFKAMHEGKILEDYWEHPPELEKTKLRDFAKTFAAVWNEYSLSLVSSS
jgi:uncharacterized protein YbjT (DUF2867 family)